MKKKKRFLSGFTLVEVLIIIGIMGILGGISFSLMRFRGGIFELQGSAQKVAFDLRQIQQMAVTTKTFEEVVYDGYGAYFDLSESNQKYWFYLDDWSNPNARAYDSVERKQEFSLEKKTYIKEITTDGILIQRLSINFRPPDPEITLTGDGTLLENREVKIIIALKSDPLKEKKIIISAPSGKIEVK